MQLSKGGIASDANIKFYYSFCEYSYARLHMHAAIPSCNLYTNYDYCLVLNSKIVGWGFSSTALRIQNPRSLVVRRKLGGLAPPPQYFRQSELWAVNNLSVVSFFFIHARANSIDNLIFLKFSNPINSACWVWVRKDFFVSQKQSECRSMNMLYVWSQLPCTLC
jgi:hypothetical protein